MTSRYKIMRDRQAMKFGACCGVDATSRACGSSMDLAKRRAYSPARFKNAFFSES
jgi:hypothetical protein